MSDVVKMYNLDFQRSVVKLLCTNRQFALNYGPLLTVEYFEHQPLRKVFKAVINYINQYGINNREDLEERREAERTGEVDKKKKQHRELRKAQVITEVEFLCEREGKGSSDLATLKTEVGAIFEQYIDSEDAIIDKLVYFCRRQAMKNALRRSIDVLDHGGKLDEIMNLINEALGVGTGDEEFFSFEDLYEVPDMIRDKYKPSQLVGTSLPSWDAALGGGFAPGELHVLQAPPKNGKTSLSICIGAEAIRRKKAVYHISLEVKGVDVLWKYFVRLNNLSYEEAQSIPRESYEAMLDGYKKYNPFLNVKYWTEGTVNALTIRSWICKMVSRGGRQPDLIIVDYDDCLLPIKRSRDNMYEDAGEIYQDLIQLADYFETPVLTFAQPQRAAWEKAKAGGIIHAHELAHSAKKVHKCFSISSLNFAEDANKGILYVDLVRRGESNVKVPVYREGHRCLIAEEPQQREERSLGLA